MKSASQPARPLAAARHILEAFRSALLPSRCANCGQWMPAVDPTPRSAGQGIESVSAAGDDTAGKDRDGWDATSLHSSGLSGLEGMLCRRCRQCVEPMAPPICHVCGRMIKGRRDFDPLCDDCSARPKHYASARSAVVYNTGFREVVHQYKYSGKIQLADPLGELLLASLLRFFDSDDMDLILPVPLHPIRFRQRGYNQAYLLMRHWHHYDRRLAPTPRLLVRKRATPPQTGLGKAERLRNIRNAFSVRHPEAVRAKRVLVVDDVYTTGATVDESARTLMRSGAARVDALTLARAV